MLGLIFIMKFSDRENYEKRLQEVINKQGEKSKNQKS